MKTVDELQSLATDHLQRTPHRRDNNSRIYTPAIPTAERKRHSVAKRNHCELERRRPRPIRGRAPCIQVQGRLLSATSRNAQMGGGGAVLGSWMDPDWVPEIMSAGRKGRSVRSRGMDGDMPILGFGKKNPNERKSRK